MQQRLFPPLFSYVLLFLVYISTFRILATLPLDTLHQSVSTMAIVGLCIYYFFNISSKLKEYKLTRLDFLIWIFIAVNFFAAYQGNKIFGQPFYYGIMAQRSVLLSLSGVMLVTL